MSIHDWYEDVIGRLSFLEKASADPSKSHEAGKIFQQMKDLFEKTCEWVNPGRLLSSAGLYNSNRYVADRLIKTQQEEIFTKINSIFSNIMKDKSFSLFSGDELRVKFFVGSEEDRLKVIEELSARGDVDTLFGCLGCCCFQGDEKWVEKILQISVNSKPFNFFVSQLDCRIFQSFLGFSCFSGNLKIVQMIFSCKRNDINPDELDTLFEVALESACAGGNVEVFQYLFSELIATTGLNLDLNNALNQMGRDILQKYVSIAADFGHLNIIVFLLSNGRQISTDAREEIILRIANSDYENIMEFLLSLGPISLSVINSAKTQARNPVIREFLTAARVLEYEVNLPQNLENIVEGTLVLALQDVSENPLKYLSLICRGFLPNRIYLVNSPCTIDLGGISKQFYTELSSGLALLIEGEQLPTLADPHSEKKQTNLLKMLGFWYSLMFEKNKVRQDPFLTGALFCREFFELIRIVALEDSDENKIKKAAIVLREKFPPLSDVILTLSAESKKEYAELMLLDSEESALENAVLKIQEYLNAAKSFYEGCDGTFQKELKEGDLAAMMTSLQGEEISKENLLKALQIVANNSSRNMKIFLNECKWIEEKIQNSTQQWMIQFVKAITGKATLSPHTKIVVKESWRNVFEIHTCFNSLDLPVILEKDTFLAALDAAISGNGYNIS